MMDYAKRFSAKNQSSNTNFPFKNHAEFPILVDILSRKDQHHVCLGANFSKQMRHFLLEALRAYLSSNHIPNSLRNAEIIYLDAEHPTLLTGTKETISKDFATLQHAITDNHCLLLAIPSELLMNDVAKQQLEILLTHPRCRLLLLAKNKPAKNRITDQFIFLPISKPDESDIITMLRQQRTELENFHNVFIPDELIELSYLLAERYLSAEQTFDNALLLLDSGAARASVTDDTLTRNTLINVLSNWTQIPPSHLTLRTLNLTNFTQEMQQQLFGQEAAINILCQKLQQPQPYWEQPSSPFFTFLFAGPEHSGKKTAAHALTEQIFKQLNVLYYAQTTSSRLNSIAEVKLQRSLEHHCSSLKDVIRQTPYAVIMFENIERASPVILDGLFEIFSTGYLHDHDENLYNFRQAIIILSTSLGTQKLTELAKVHSQQDESQHLDWLQLVMTDPKRDNRQVGHHYSPQDIAQEIIPEITTRLPAALCQHLCIVPFLPLTQTMIEKIIRLKLKVLGKEMDLRYNIELGYAPEVIRFLAKEVLAKQNSDHHNADIKKALQPLYFSVEQAVLSQANNENRPNQLFLQLNETGQFLRCDYVAFNNLPHTA